MIDIIGFIVICVVVLVLFIGFLISENEKEKGFQKEIEYEDDYGKWR